MGLSSLISIGCTALMRASSLKHPPGSLQFAKLGKRMVSKTCYIFSIMEEGVNERKDACEHLCIAL